MSGETNKIAEALAAVYAETGNPVYAWLCIGQLHGGRFDKLPPVIADYLSGIAGEFSALTYDTDATAAKKSERLADVLHFKGSGRANPFSKYADDLKDVRAFKALGMHKFLQELSYGMSRRETALADTTIARSTAITRLKNGERLSKIWRRFFP